jgi:hypothetical protein
MNTRNLLALSAAAAIVAASAAPASAYVLLSPRRTWASTPVAVGVNSTGNSSITDGSGGSSKVAQAIGTWGKCNGSVTGASAVRGDGKPIIMLNTNGNVCTGSCLAATLTGYYHQNSDGTYSIDDADIYTNQNYNYVSTGESDGCASEYYIEGIMVHETGHLLGLGHSSVSGSTMYPSVSACNNGPASLENDDKSAIADLYGGGGGTCHGKGCK